MSAAAICMLTASLSFGADVTLTGSDAFGESSFNSGLHWSDGLTPGLGNDYFTGDLVLRTPPDGGSYVFGGDSLSVNNTAAYPNGLLFKGTGTTAIITVPNLILNGGIISHANGVGDLFQLDGAITITSASAIYAKQGNIDVLAEVSGTGNLLIPATDAPSEDNRYVTFYGANTGYTGSLNVGGRFRLAAGGGLTFVIGASEVNNSVAGRGTAVFDGIFRLDLSGAGANPGDVWTIASVSSQSFGATFSVDGFSESASGMWTDGTYQFSEATGVLSYGAPPGPSTILPLVTLTVDPSAPNAAWSWFEDERCIIDADAPHGPRLLVSSVSSAANGDAESGDVDVVWLDLVGGAIGQFELADRLQRDDHDSAALWVRPDGRYLAVYSKHTADTLTRWRISTNPHDPTAWEAEVTHNVGANTTYNNVHYLPADNGGAGRLYDFTRAINWDPTVLTSSNHGTSWTGGGKLMTMGGSSDRPYVRYFSNGDRIHFITTEEHPRDFDNSVYHGYIRDGVSYDSDGVIVDANIFDAGGPAPTSFTPVFLTGQVFGGTPMRRAWTIDVAIDGDEPVVMFIARANGSTSDHRFFYARHAPGTGWSVYEVAAAGGFLYAAEDDYTGLAAIDPDDPGVIVVSTNIDPRHGSPTPNYEMYQGSTVDGGATWSWTPLTSQSGVDNLRPLIPAYTDGIERVMIWMRGTYSSYTSWDTEAVVMCEVLPDRIDWRCVGGPDLTSLPPNCPAVQFSALDRDRDGDVDMHDVREFQHEALVMTK